MSGARSDQFPGPHNKGKYTQDSTTIRTHSGLPSCVHAPPQPAPHKTTLPTNQPSQPPALPTTQQSQIPVPTTNRAHPLSSQNCLSHTVHLTISARPTVANAPTHVAACITSFLPTDLPLLRSQRSPPLSSLNRTRVRRAANVGLPRFKCHSLRSLCHQRQPPGLRRPQEDPVSCQESIGSRDICDHKARRFNATFVGHDSILRWGGIQGETWRYIPRRAGHGTSPLHSPLCTRHEHHSCLLFSYTQPRPPFPTRITSTPLPLTYHYLGICARPHILAPRHPPPP